MRAVFGGPLIATQSCYKIKCSLKSRGLGNQENQFLLTKYIFHRWQICEAYFTFLSVPFVHLNSYMGTLVTVFRYLLRFFIYCIRLGEIDFVSFSKIGALVSYENKFFQLYRLLWQNSSTRNKPLFKTLYWLATSSVKCLCWSSYNMCSRGLFWQLETKVISCLWPS